MKTQVILNKNDVQRIVAKHYNVDKKNVEVNLFMETEGYGMGEHEVPKMEITVTTGEEQQ